MVRQVPLTFRLRSVFLLLATVAAFVLGWVAARAVPRGLLVSEKNTVVVPLAREVREVRTESKPEPVSQGGAVAGEKKQDESPEFLSLGEVSAGSERSVSDEYVDIRNPNGASVPLDGWSLKKVDGKGRESTLVTPARFRGVVVPSGGVVRVANANAELAAQVRWPASYGLAYEANGVVLRRPDGTVADAVRWEVLTAR